MKNQLKLTTLLVSSCLFSAYSHAVDINLTIVGNGTVAVSENGTECTESCSINNTDQVNTLVPTAQNGEQFLGWTGQKCDSGSGVIVDQNFNVFHRAGSGAKTLVAGDIDNDGREDLAAISLFTGEVIVMRNQGDAEFSSKAIAADLNYPTAMDFYDWDNDGDQDLLVVDFRPNKIKVYTNDGSGEFSYHKDIMIENANVYAIAVKDINQDSFPDLITSSFNANISGNLQTLVDSINESETRWYLNDGDDQFLASTLVSNTAAITLDVIDNNKFNTIDVVAAEIQSGDIAVYRLANEAVSRQVVTNGRGAYGAAFSDIDNDGHMDVLSAHYQPSVAKLTYGNDSDSFSGATDIRSFSEGVTATAFIDVNEDGYLDPLIGEFNTNEFGYIETLSYKDCVVSSDASINLTANFSEQSTSPDTSEVENKKDSSGGSFGYLMGLLLLLTCFRSKQNKYQE